jgi:hypothetical protein
LTAFSHYRAQVNTVCRSYTPRLQRLERDMTSAERAGWQARADYDLGVILALTLKQGLQIERIPVPADARAVIAQPLRLLHEVDVQTRRVLSAAVADDNPAVRRELATLAKISAPLNREFDAVGLRDCGSGQQ